MFVVPLDTFRVWPLKSPPVLPMILVVQSHITRLMSTHNIGGSGNSGRIGKDAEGSEPRSSDLIPVGNSDGARIIDSDGETAGLIAKLTARVRREVGDRDVIVEAARQKLMLGELDSAAVMAATAERLARSGYLSV